MQKQSTDYPCGCNVQYSSLLIQCYHPCGYNVLITVFNLADTVYSCLCKQDTYTCGYNILIPGDIMYSSLRIKGTHPCKYSAMILPKTIILRILVITMYSSLKIQCSCGYFVLISEDTMFSSLWIQCNPSGGYNLHIPAYTLYSSLQIWCDHSCGDDNLIIVTTMYSSLRIQCSCQYNILILTREQSRGIEESDHDDLLRIVSDHLSIFWPKAHCTITIFQYRLRL